MSIKDVPRETHGLKINRPDTRKNVNAIDHSNS